jgi:hypothetical protein
MPRTKTAPDHTTEPGTQGSVRAAGEEPAHTSLASAPIAEFDAAAHRKEIAQVAYRIWLERADRPGSPEEDWLKAESQVRAKYTR